MTAIQKQNSGLKPEQIIEIILNRRWFIIIPLCISLTLGLGFTLTSTKVYQASTTILIQPQKVPTQYIQSIVSTDLNQRLSTIAQQILSRSNLEKIITQFGLFEDEKMYLEDKVDNLRRRINVKIENNRKADAEAFSVSFTDSNPERVMKIANTLATYFMDENLKVREIQAVGTSEFLDSELTKLKQRLEEKEELLSQFRTKYMGGLPDELESNLRTLDRLQQQLTDKQNALRDAKTGISVVSSQISRAKQLREEFLQGSSSVEDIGKGGEIRSEAEQLYYNEKTKLDELLLKYKNNHPEVIKLTKSVEKLKEKLELEAKKNQGKNISGTKNTGETGVASNQSFSKAENALFTHEMQIRQLNNEIIKLESDIAEIKNLMVVYQQRVEDTPKREQELRSLERDYNNIRENYNSLLDRQLEAEIAVNMEKKQKGEQFRILDYAKIPEKPISPDIRKLFMFSIAIGLGLGGGIIFLLEFLDKSIRRPEEIETEFGLPVLASIPSLKINEDKGKKRIELILFSICSFYVFSVLLMFALVNYKGLDETVNFIKKQLNF